MCDARAMFEAGLQRYRSMLRLLARSLLQKQRLGEDPSDLVHDTLFQAHRDLGQFRGSTEAELFAWLRQILRHNFHDVCEKARAAKRDRDRVISEADLALSFAGLDDLLIAPGTSPSERAVRNEELYRLAEALDQLPQRQHQAISLMDLAGLSLRETAERMALTPAALAGLLYRGRLRLHELLGGTTDAH